jgi:hypothetical protein
MQRRGYISSIGRAVLESYYEVASQINNYENLRNYTNEIEASVNGSSIRDRDKKQLLIVLATSRYSSGAWLNGQLF